MLDERNNIGSFKLVIKNIPENFSDNQLQELLIKNFENKVKDINIIKTVHKYSKNNKICFITIESFDTRKQILDFFSSFELVDPKGLKTKLLILDCLYQTKIKENKDINENTINESILYFN